MRGPWGNWKTAWIFPGGENLPRKIDLKREVPESGTSLFKSKRKKVLHIDPRQQEMYVEGGLAVGDFTGDTIDDLVLAMILKSSPPRRRFCLLAGGRNIFRKSIFDTKNNCVMIGGTEDIESMGIGPFVPLPTMGDYNGDGRQDFFFMAWGQVHFGVFGQDLVASTADVETMSQVKISPPNLTMAGFGLSTKLGDFNGDGKDDLFILSSLEGGGTVYVILGKAEGVNSSPKIKNKKP